MLEGEGEHFLVDEQDLPPIAEEQASPGTQQSKGAATSSPAALRPAPTSSLQLPAEEVGVQATSAQERGEASGATTALDPPTPTDRSQEPWRGGGQLPQDLATPQLFPCHHRHLFGAAIDFVHNALSPKSQLGKALSRRVVKLSQSAAQARHLLALGIARLSQNFGWKRGARVPGSVLFHVVLARLGIIFQSPARGSCHGPSGWSYPMR